MHDLLIKGGTVLDGTGRDRFTADVAITDGIITEVGRVTTPGRETIDAEGALVTPGFVDVHTHYDGQFLWDDRIEPSFSHGVTTAIGGNCGVGFAPVRPEHRQALIAMMEGVEEIPGIVLDEGLDWDWKTFPDFLDRIGDRTYTMDVALHLTHAPLRVFTMGERALRHEDATPDDIAVMAQLTGEAMSAGAVGFSAARILEHRSSNGDHVPGTFASDDELIAIALAMGKSGHGTYQIVPQGSVGSVMAEGSDRAARVAEHERIVAIARACRRPVTYSISEFASDPGDLQMMVDASARASAADGIDIRPQTAARGVGTLTTLDGYHPFMLKPSYREIAHLPRADRAAAMRQPERRAAILAENDDRAVAGREPILAQLVARLQRRADETYPLSLPIDYEPGPEQQAGAQAAIVGVPSLTFLYDHYSGGNGENVAANFVLNYVSGNLDPVYDMLRNPNVISGLGDGGAHMKLICDASLPTFQLAFWGRDRTRGPKLPLEMLVAKLTKDGANLYGLSDRGEIAVGKRADLNVIDYSRLALDLPRMAFDLPHGSPRLLQGATGYLATVVGGQVTRRHDAETGARPGRLVRGRAHG